MKSHTPRRWQQLSIAVSLSTVLVGSLVVATPAAAAQDHRTWTDRAVQAYDAMQTHLYLGGNGNKLYLESYPKQTGDNDYSYFWPMREATVATVGLSRLPKIGDRYERDVADRFAAINHYWDFGHGAYDSYPTAPLAGGGDQFYDDNAIIGLDFIQQYRSTRESSMLDRAIEIFRFIETGWDTDPSRPCEGGLHWVDASWNTGKATNSTSLAAELAVHLYEETNRHHYLRWGKRAYEWVRNCLRSPEGLYYNDISFDGIIDETLWVYNSGAMIGAATLLYRATGDHRYYVQARQDADAALDYWTDGDRNYQQPAIFNAIFFSNLLLLDSEQHDPSYRAALAHYANLIWQRNRDPQTGLYSFQPSGGGSPNPEWRPETLEQSAVIQIFAMLGWKTKEFDGEEQETTIATGIEIVGPEVVREPYSTVQLDAEFTPAGTSYQRAEWSVTEPDGSPTEKAEIDYFGALTVNDQEGDVRVTARAADGGGATTSEIVTIDLDPRLLRGNAARWPGVTTSASSEFNGDYAADKVRDGITGQWAVGEWASAGEQSPWIQLDWDKPIEADKIMLYDRSISEDANAGTLTFSDGTSIEVTGIPAGGGPKTVRFPLKTVDWVRFQVTAGTGPNVGLSEFEVYAVPSAPGTPSQVSAEPGQAEATVSWQPPAFDGGAPLTGYVVSTYRDGTKVNTKTVNEDVLTTVASGLEPGQPYQFTVTATNLMGAGPESAPAVAGTVR